MQLTNIEGKIAALFSRQEIEAFYREYKQEAILEEVNRLGMTLENVGEDKALQEKITDAISKQMMRDHWETEVFASIFTFWDSYPPETEIGFFLKDSFRKNVDSINGLKDLKKHTIEKTLTDFIYRTGNDVRLFQLKQLKGDSTTNEIVEFIKEKSIHYGMEFGNDNLMVILQPSPFTKLDIDFQEIHEKVKVIGIKSSSEILISYNDNNQEMVINEVYPKLNTCRRKIKFYANVT